MKKIERNPVEADRSPVVVGPREMQLFTSSDQSTIDALVKNLGASNEEGRPRLKLANDTLPDFDQFPKFLDQLRRYILWLSVRKQVNEVIELGYNPQLQNAMGEVVHWGRLKMHRAMSALRIKTDLIDDLHRSIPEIYNWLTILLKVTEEGNFAVQNGQNNQQREGGYEYLHAALMLTQRLKEVAFAIERQLRNNPEIDKKIEEAIPLDVVLSELSGETISEIERMRDAREGYCDDGHELADRIHDAEGLAEVSIAGNMRRVK